MILCCGSGSTRFQACRSIFSYHNYYFGVDYLYDNKTLQQQQQLLRLLRTKKTAVAATTTSPTPRRTSSSPPFFAAQPRFGTARLFPQDSDPYRLKKLLLLLVDSNSYNSSNKSFTCSYNNNNHISATHHHSFLTAASFIVSTTSNNNYNNLLLRHYCSYTRERQSCYCYHKRSFVTTLKSSIIMADVPAKKKVCIVGSGNWGSAIAKIIGNNVHGGHDEFDSTVNMYVYEEMFEDKKLSEIINQEHENKKYLPGIKLPDNVVAVPDLPTAADGADILVFVVPHQFIRGLCKQLDGKIKKGAIAVSLIKGLDVKDGGGLLLISDVITECLSIPCHVLMGANLAGEVAGENYCEATVGSRDIKEGLLLKRLLQTKYFRLVVVEDAVTVEICGALKNIVAVGAGFADGLGYGDNTKAAVIRLGLMEMIKFVDTFYEGTKPATFLESCGVADLVTTCYGGRNRRVAEAMVKTGKSLEVLEKEMLNGQKLQGPPTAAEVSIMLKAQNKEDVFPIFHAIHEICQGSREPDYLKEVMCRHPVHEMERDIPYMEKFYGSVEDLATKRSSYFDKNFPQS